MIQKIKRDELKNWVDRSTESGLILIEATPGETYNRLHLPGAVQLGSPEELEAWFALERPSRDRPIVCYAESPVHLGVLVRFARMLLDWGYSNVSVYPDGKDDWMLARLPTESVYYRAENALVFSGSNQGVEDATLNANPNAEQIRLQFSPSEREAA